MTSEENREEMQYLGLIQTILEKGVTKDDRTGTGTISIFGTLSRYSLENNALPLLTTKKITYRLVIEELLFFVRGETDSNLLRKRDVNIWNQNGSCAFLLSRGIDREEGDLGPVYGFQWRHFGAKYRTCHDTYSGEGIDQLGMVIKELKSNPMSRRLVVSAWNPLDLDIMALPPCHVLYQFEVSNGKLNCMLYQRSGDVGLGVPFNIASYALLLKMVSYLVKIPEGELVHVIGDTHIYSNHVEQLREQMQRVPRPFPKVYLRPPTERKSIEEFEASDFVVEGYDPHPPIKMQMSV
jgi:thymidylate synthase